MEFTTPNIIVANPIPDETKIYYSKNKELTAIILWVFVLLIGVYLLTLGTDYFAAALLFFVLAGAFIYFKYKTFSDTTPQIILNIDGVQTINNPFNKWSEIDSAGITKLEIRGSTFYHFTYKTHQGNELSIRIDNFNIRVNDLRLLLHFTRKSTRIGISLILI